MEIIIISIIILLGAYIAKDFIEYKDKKEQKNIKIIEKTAIEKDTKLLIKIVDPILFEEKTEEEKKIRKEIEIELKKFHEKTIIIWCENTEAVETTIL